MGSHYIFIAQYIAIKMSFFSDMNPVFLYGYSSLLGNHIPNDVFWIAKISDLKSLYEKLLPSAFCKVYMYNRKTMFRVLCFYLPFAVLTTFSFERRTPSFPNRTWKGEHWNVPSCWRTTMTSIHPERVAWLMPLYSSFTVTRTCPASCPT